MDVELAVDASTRNALLAQVHRHTGIFMAERKWTLLQGRLRRRLQELAPKSYREYLALLEGSTDEVGHFIDLVTTNETSFFRTQRIWDYLWQDFLPTWQAAHPAATLQVWSAAASTGEEAYTAAMLFEEFRLQHPGFRYRILGTDIARRVLEVGRAGKYQGRNIDGLRKIRPALLDKNFLQVGDHFSVIPALRAGITFREHHLHKRLADPTRFDLVLLRNVLIYFDEPGQEGVLENVRQSMVPGGVLLVGESESLGRIRTGFRYLQPLIYSNDKAPA
jgi:chemotaxis protein methyltransferase CheR